MFISIPKEFFVPVVYGEGFILNEDNNNLELDTDLYRESTKSSVKKTEVIKDYSESKEKSYSIKAKKDTEDMSDKKVTGEKVQNNKEKVTVKKECAELNAMYIELKKNDVTDKCNMCTDMFTELDDEYIGSVGEKNCKYKK